MEDQSLSRYEPIVGEEALWELEGLAAALAGARVVHVSSPGSGGSVAEILGWMVPVMRSLGLDARAVTVEGDGSFLAADRVLREGLQGDEVAPDREATTAYEATLDRNAEALGALLEAADFVFVHDPLPAGLLARFPDRRGRWLWRCHLDVSSPYLPAWELVRERVEGYDATIFSAKGFAREVGPRQLVIAPSIDPLSPKNADLGEERVEAMLERLGVGRDRPLITQVSRFDRTKDPLGTIEAFRKGVPAGAARLVVAGPPADDPTEEQLLDRARAAAGEVDGAEVLVLPPGSHEEINALQRAATVVVQKALRGGSGLAVAEALWKARPVIGGDTETIRPQIDDGESGYVVRSAGAAGARMAALVAAPELARRLGEAGRAKVLRDRLFNRELSEHLAALIALR